MSDFDPRIPRELAVRLGEEAVDISAQTLTSIKKTSFYEADHSHQPASTGSHATQIEVTNETTLSAHQRHLAKGLNAVLLNFASATSPGGGFLGGARAQEEYLCRSSALFVTIKDSPMYAYHRDNWTPFYSDAMIYSVDVPVFRDDQHELLATPYLASFITSAAPLAKKVLPDDYPKLPNVLIHRILKILSVAKSKGHDSLILGAWGCGAFGNDGHLVSELFHRALTVEFAGSFKEVTFAIVDTSPELRFIGPFAQRFSAKVEPCLISPPIPAQAARDSMK